MKALALLLVLLMPLSILMADNYVEVNFNSMLPAPNAGKLAIGQNNRLEIWMENDFLITGLSMGFEVYGYNGVVVWDTTYGNIPPLNIEDENMIDAMVYVEMLQFEAPGQPDSFIVGGFVLPNASEGISPDDFRLALSLQVFIPEGEPSGELCLKPVKTVPSGVWLWTDGMSDMSPDFYDCVIDDENNPDCPGVCFEVTNLPPLADFSFEPECGVYPVTVDFTDLTMFGPDTWMWDFDDGGSSFDQNPIYTYNAPGEYYPQLTASNATGQSDMTSTEPITVYDSLDVDFMSNTTNGTAPLYVLFQAQFNYEPDSLLWSFGDGSGSTDMNASHLFNDVGVYDVTLEAWVCGVHFSTLKEDFITVTETGLSEHVCGDVNCDGLVNVSDAVYIINYSFIFGAKVPCEDCP